MREFWHEVGNSVCLKTNKQQQQKKTKNQKQKQKTTTTKTTTKTTTTNKQPPSPPKTTKTNKPKIKQTNKKNALIIIVFRHKSCFIENGHCCVGSLLVSLEQELPLVCTLILV